MTKKNLLVGAVGDENLENHLTEKTIPLLKDKHGFFCDMFSIFRIQPLFTKEEIAAAVEQNQTEKICAESLRDNFPFNSVNRYRILFELRVRDLRDYRSQMHSWLPLVVTFSTVIITVVFYQMGMQPTLVLICGCIYFFAAAIFSLWRITHLRRNIRLYDSLIRVCQSAGEELKQKFGKVQVEE